MQTIIYNISQVIGVAIIHSLWQGLLIYLTLRVLLLIFPAFSSAARHNIAMTALSAMTVWFVYTLSKEISLYTWVVLQTDNKGIFQDILNLPIHGKHVLTYSARYYYTIEGILPYITIIYITGLIFNTGKLLWARNQINSIRQNMSIDFQLQLKVAEFVGILNISKKIQFGLSKLVDVPCVIGYFKPVILLPFTLSSNLSAEEIEIIILHELAHIKRNDYLINVAQQVMSVLLFFNPFAQLINRIINHERENSCDDIVIEATQKPLVYAHALLKLEQARKQEWQLALAATGKKYHLLNRIERIMKTKKPIGKTRHILLAIALLTASITGLAWLNPTIANGKISINKIKPVSISNLLTDTLHKKATKSHKAGLANKAPKSKYNYDYQYNYQYGNEYYGMNDPKLNELSKEVSKYGDVISKYYNGPEMKKLQEDMEKRSQQMEAFDNNPQFKQLQEDMERKSADFDKLNDNPEMHKMQEQMEKMSVDIQKYYDSPEFKKMQKEITDNAAALGKLKYDSPEFKKKSQQLAELSKQMGEYSQSATVKQQQDEIRKMSESIRDYYNSPDYTKLRDEIRIYGDSIRKAYQSTQFKMQQEEIRKLSDKMRAMNNNPEIKKNQELMRQATERMRAYMNTPEFKKRLEEYKKNTPNWGDNDNFEKPEKPEKPEAPEFEKPEKPEKPDASVKPTLPAPPPVAPVKPDSMGN